MAAEIHYFSGTGNTLAVARDVAAGLGAIIVPIASAVKWERIRPDSDTIGIITPVYYGELPVIIKRFVEKLDGIENKYIFAVCTFGGSAGYSLKLLRGLIEKRGGTLAATYRVHMPQNAFAKPWEKHSMLYATAKRQARRIARYTLQRKRGEYFRRFLTAPLFLLVDYVVHRMRASYRKSFRQISGAPDTLTMDELILLNDTSYTVNDDCAGCGICAAVCPVENIVMEESKPVWQHRCENCLACYNWCPSRAIRGKIAHEGFFYRHPDIKVKEVMAKRSAE